MKPTISDIRINQSIRENTVYIEGDEILTAPIASNAICHMQVVGSDGDILDRVLVGIGSEGDGLILDYTSHDGKPTYKLEQIYNPGTNIIDILPGCNHMDPRANDVIIAGDSCAQSGVRHVSSFSIPNRHHHHIRVRSLQRQPETRPQQHVHTAA